jgi:hypothetical protein
MLMEGVITLIIVAAIFYVAPGVMYSVSKSSGTIVTAAADVGNTSGLCITSGCGVLGSPALNASQVSIGTTAAGALNLSTIGLIMLGIGIMIGGFMLIRGYK